MNITILPFDTIASTNIEAINQARHGAGEGLCVTAKQQTAGRGRHGRTWISPENAGIYFSIVLRPKINVQFFPLITFVGAIAVFESLQELYNLKPDIKWANDVLVDDRKICGILAETTETAKGPAVILGIGINLSSSNFPSELKDSATSIETELGSLPVYDELLEALISRLTEFYMTLSGEGGARRIREEWAKRSSYAFGKRVSVSLGAASIFGTTCGIEENGALRIVLKNGEVQIIQSGEVEKIRDIR